MDKVKATVKPLYAQAASIGVTVLLWILLVVAVAVDEFSAPTKELARLVEAKDRGLKFWGFDELGWKKTWAQAAYVLLIFTILFQIAALVCHGLFFKMPNLKSKLFIALIVVNALTFLISTITLGFWDSKVHQYVKSDIVTHGASYNCIGACIFFEILNFLLLALLKLVGGA